MVTNVSVRKILICVVLAILLAFFLLVLTNVRFVFAERPCPQWVWTIEGWVCQGGGTVYVPANWPNSSEPIQVVPASRQDEWCLTHWWETMCQYQ
jgi:hypothetical protein